jgi:hypothetical protein
MSNIKLDIVASHLKTKKYNAIFTIDSDQILVIPFGAKGYGDYTTHKSERRKMMYLNRHYKNEDWNNPFSAGALSRWILWGPYTNLDNNIISFKNRFGFN